MLGEPEDSKKVLGKDRFLVTSKAIQAVFEDAQDASTRKMLSHSQFKSETNKKDRKPGKCVKGNYDCISSWKFVSL